MSIRVVVADDEAMVRSGLRLLLDSTEDIEVVGEAADGLAAIEEVRRTAPDVVLLDIRMPRMGGLAAARRLLEGPDPPRVIMLTTFDEDEHLYEALRLGTSGFLLKVAPAEQLIEAVRQAYEGNALIDPAVTKRVIETWGRTPAQTQPSSRPELDVLTARECDVLRLIGRGLSNREIAGELVVGEATVKTHVNHILMKLGLAARAQAVVFAYEAGLVRVGDT